MAEADIEHLLARQEIQDVLARYCRGLDRMDREMALSVWHADGTALYHDMYEGTGHGFIDWVWDAHTIMQRHSHQLANTLIKVDGDEAMSESYVTVALWTEPDGEGRQQEIISRGRYLDRWSKRHGRWAIDHREHVVDLQTIQDLQPGNVSAAGTRDASDPSFGYLAAGGDPDVEAG